MSVKIKRLWVVKHKPVAITRTFVDDEGFQQPRYSVKVRTTPVVSTHTQNTFVHLAGDKILHTSVQPLVMVGVIPFHTNG